MRNEIDVALVGDSAHQATIAFNNVFIEPRRRVARASGVTVDSDGHTDRTMSRERHRQQSLQRALFSGRTAPVVREQRAHDLARSRNGWALSSSASFCFLFQKSHTS